MPFWSSTFGLCVKLFLTFQPLALTCYLFSIIKSDKKKAKILFPSLNFICNLFFVPKLSKVCFLCLNSSNVHFLSFCQLIRVLTGRWLVIYLVLLNLTWIFIFYFLKNNTCGTHSLVHTCFALKYQITSKSQPILPPKSAVKQIEGFNFQCLNPNTAVKPPRETQPWNPEATDNITAKEKLNTTTWLIRTAQLSCTMWCGRGNQIEKCGAIILGKATLSEWAHYRSYEAPSGWNAKGRWV